jgi:hypothetical protein
MKYETKEAFDKANMFGQGNPNDGFAQYFVGNSFLNRLLISRTASFRFLT